ncbi:MAG: amidohydrolase family protein [Caulobacteraceae bacterium]|nr:amidohydrolase family protein [Caulobacteraceae bacterium]
MVTFANARVFDGREMLAEPHCVTVEGGLIASVRPGSAAAGDAIDLAGMTLMPGLVSAHMHPDNLKFTYQAFLAGDRLGLERPPGVLTAIGVRTCKMLIETGFTGYVGAGCSNNIDAQLKMAIEEEIIPGPRIRPCSHHVGTTADANDSIQWWLQPQRPGTDIFADGPDSLRGAVREEIRNGAQIIKIYVSSGHAVPGRRGKRNMSSDEIAAVVAAAHDRGVKVRAHVCHKELILESLALGVDLVDHGDETDEACIDAMAEAGAFWVPSLAFLKIALDGGMDPDGSARYAHDNLLRTIPLAQKRGVRLLLGDDYGGGAMAHAAGSYARELPLYGAIEGLSATEVLGWATRNGGELLMDGPGRAGVIAPGAVADLIVVDGDPTQDLTLLQRPEASLKAVLRAGAFQIDRLDHAMKAQPAQRPILEVAGR